MEYLPLFLLMWWTFGVLLIFGKHEEWVKFYDRVPGLAMLPQHYVLLLVLLVCIVVFPIPMLAPFEVVWSAMKQWRQRRKVRRAVVRAMKALRKGQTGELAKRFDDLIEKAKRI